MKELVTSALDVLALLAMAVGMVLVVASRAGLGVGLASGGLFVAVVSALWAYRRDRRGGAG